MCRSSETAFPRTLERRRTSDSLQRHLEQRPEREELIEREISFLFLYLYLINDGCGVVLTLMVDRKHPSLSQRSTGHPSPSARTAETHARG